MASAFFQVGLRRSFLLLRQSRPALHTLARCARPKTAQWSPIMTQAPPRSTTPSRLLNLLTQRSVRPFSSSSRKSIRYPARPPPPPHGTNFLGFLNRIPQKAILYGIMGLNAAVFAMWYFAKQQHEVNRDAGPLIWMYQNFTSSWASLKSGRVWTLITSFFSHKDFGHILFNGFTFFFMSPIVLQVLGSRKFVLLYMGAGIASSCISLLYGRYIDRKDVPSLGASGAIFGVTTFLACVAPTMTFQLYGIVPVPAWLVITGLFAYDAYSTYTDNRGTTDTVGHIGGMLSGALYFIFLRRAGRIR